MEDKLAEDKVFLALTRPSVFMGLPLEAILPIIMVWIGVQKGPPWRGDRRPTGTPHFDGLDSSLGILRLRDRDVGGGDCGSYPARVRWG